MTTDTEAKVQELWDRDRIARLPRTYAKGVDTRNWDLVRACFAKDAFIEGHEPRPRSTSTWPI